MKSVPPIINMVDVNETRASKTVEHLAINCRKSDWTYAIGDLVTRYGGKSGRVLIFGGSRKTCSKLGKSGRIYGARMIHGGIKQAMREETLKAFREGQIRVLIGTDVAARGLDIPEIDLVIQTVPPTEIDWYIHRSGRTGRAGRSGICICLYEPKQVRIVLFCSKVI